MTGHASTLDMVFDKTRTYKTATFMTLASVLVSASIILYYNSSGLHDVATSNLSGLSLQAVTLLPYMISAVIAAITALGVMSMLPTAKVAEPARQFVCCLQEMREGDLTVRVRLKADDPLRDLAAALNDTATSLGGEIANWKVINRQQWGVLCHIRHAVESGDSVAALDHIAQMEQNWDKIAEIEQRFIA